MPFAHPISSARRRIDAGAADRHWTALLRRVAAVRRRWSTLWLDPRTRYLSAATDHVDLERRLLAYDEYVRRTALQRAGSP
jgi:hypothetical protein